MNENVSNNNSQVSALLSAYSIQEITSIFSEIDAKILALHSCSSDDFLTLNAYFKKYYTDSKTISNNATTLFQIITNEEDRKLFTQNIRAFQSSLQDLLVTYEKLVNGVILAINSMIQEMDQMFVTANNLKQDLMTLKLLVANLKLDIIIFPSSISKIAKKTNDFNELIVQTKSFFIEFYKNSSHFKDALKSFNGQLAQHRDRNLQHMHEMLNEISYTSNLLDQKNSEAMQLIPKLSENTQNTSNSIAKIITNLQYQDIIRQKIDHIQQTHKDIFKQLNQVPDSGDEETNLQTRVRCFIQIRDIAGLQAAQLIHANKEYQKAIETIASKFLEVGTDMTKISDLCHQLIGTPNSSTGSHFDTISENLEKTGYFTEVFQKSLNFLRDKLDYNKNQLNEVLDKFNELSDFLGTIEKSITRSLDNQTKVEVEQFETTTEQIRNILKELRFLNDQYHKQFNNIKELYSWDFQKNPSDSFDVESKLHTFSKECVNLIGNLYDTNESIYKILSENQTLSKQISLDIKTSLEQIRYYDFFDKVIEEIILKLNEINMKLQNVDDTSSETRQKHLEFLKTRYTMESEHIIHDHLTKNDIDINNLHSTAAEEDDDNLELF